MSKVKKEPKYHNPASKENGKLGGRPRKWNGEKIEELADSLDEWIADAMQNRNEFWWWDWCFDVGLTPQKVQILAERSDRFRESVEKAKAWQESIVARFALTKKFSDNFSRFFLLSSHGSDKWRDKSADIQRESLLEDIEKLIEERKSGTPSRSEVAPQ